MHEKKLRRRSTLALLAGPPVLAACDLAAGGHSGLTGGGITRASSGRPIEAHVAGSDMAVGRNRFAVAVLDVRKSHSDEELLADAQLNLRFFFPIRPQPVPRGEVLPEFRYVGDNRNRGVYVAQVEFDQPGNWGVEVTGTADGQVLAPARLAFTVKEKSDSPALGLPAPRSRNLTRWDVDDIRKIDSGIPPNDMHDLTIAEAIDEHKPLVVAFASPGYCTSKMCSPELDEVRSLKAKYGEQANFIHIEIYKDVQTLTPYETVEEWGLTTDPWVFMVDKMGLIADKFEGPAPVSELESALGKLL